MLLTYLFCSFLMRISRRKKWRTSHLMLAMSAAAAVVGFCGLWTTLSGGSTTTTDLLVWNGQHQQQQQKRDLSATTIDVSAQARDLARARIRSPEAASSSISAAAAVAQVRPTASGHRLETRRQQNPSGGAFVHMGKTGGSTLSILLRNGCHSYRPHPCRTIEPREHESAASKRIESYYHVPDFGLLPRSHHDFYLLTTRDPLDRTVSAFVFEHIRNKDARNETIDEFKRPKYEEAYKCFPTLQSFVELLGDDSTRFQYPYSKAMVVADSCTDLARAAFHGRVKIYNHLFFSYQKIGSLIPDVARQKLYLTRQEHLWEDWIGINRLLGQPAETIRIPAQPEQQQQQQQQQQHAVVVRNTTVYELRNQLPVKRDLDARGREILCRALRDEYRAYFWFLRHAANLSPHHVSQSLQYSKSNCPSSVAIQ